MEIEVPSLLKMASAILISSCLKEDFTEEIATQDPTTKAKTINFKGLQVNHRFLTSEDELKLMAFDYQPKQLYNDLVHLAKNKSRAKGLNTITDTSIYLNKTIGEEIPSAAILLEATKKVIADFPFHKLEGFIETDVDTTKTIDIEMIKKDFSSLTEQQIKEKIKLIDEYYSKNLDYMVLNEIAKNKELYQVKKQLHNKSNDFVKQLCISAKIGLLYGVTRTAVAGSLANDQAIESSKNHFELLPESNSRRDAYRHSLVSALLAKYYWSVLPSKSWRVDFSKAIMDEQETGICGSDVNDLDAREMDYHNNAIGRDVWLSTATWDKLLGVNIGVSSASPSTLKDLLLNRVARGSVLIVKGNLEPNKLLSQYQYSITEVQSIIKSQIPVGKLVYFHGKIAPEYYTYKITTYITDCDPGLGPVLDGGDNGIIIGVDSEGNCIKEITITTKHSPIFITKDPTYDPFK